MKKLLALVLALVMSMSLVTISNAAFKDADTIDNKEAVEVMNAIGVLVGDDKGNFNADANLTRAQAAKIICVMLLGKDAADGLNLKSTFSDASGWAESYIAYCASQGIVAGVGDGKFDPNGKLTGYQFAKMLLVALGYKADVEGMTGTDWQVNVAKLALNADLAKGLEISLSKVLTRDEAAQMAFNTLKADMVEYDEKGSTITAGDVTIVTGAQKAKNVTVKASTGTNEYATKISGETIPGTGTIEVTVELGEKLYKGDLTLGVSSTSTDAYGRPATTWQYKGTDVASDVSSAKVTFSAGLNSANGKKQIASDLKGYKFNGVEIKTKDTAVGATGGATVGALTVANSGNIVDAVAALTANGKVVEFYADSNKNITDVVVISYTVAKVTNVTTNKKGDVSYTISGLGSAKIDYADDYANTDTIAVEGTVAKNDYVLYVVDANDSNLYHVYAATKVTGQQTATDGTTLTIGGTKYKLGKGVAGYNSYTYANSSKEANYFLDKFGYVVASSDVEADLVYAVVNKIVGKDTTTGLNTGKSAEAELILTDGSKTTVKVSKINGIEVKDFTIPTDATAGAVNWNASHDVTGVTLNKTVANNSALNGQIVSYTVDDGKYELTFAETPASVTTAVAGTLTNKGVPGFGVGQTGANSGTNSTVYVVKTYKSGTTDEVVKSYTGFANVPTIAATAGNTLTAKYVIDDGKVVFVYIDATTNSAVGESTTDNVFYVTSATVTENGTSSDKYYTVEGILDGAKATIKSKVVDFKVLAGSTAMSADTFYTLNINEDGYVTSAAPTSFSANGTADQALIDSIADGTFGGYLTNDKTKVYVIDDGEVTEGAPEAIAIGDAWNVMLKTTGTAAEKNTIETLYIVVA